MIKSASSSSILTNEKHSSMSAGAVPSNEYLISTTIVGATPVSSVTFDVSAYADIYRHLKVVAVARTSRAAVGDSIRMQFNGSSASYNAHILFGNGTSVTSDYYSSTTLGYMEFQRFSGANAATDAFGAGTFDILDFSKTTKNTTVKALCGVAGLGGQEGQIHLGSGGWANTAAVTSITLYPASLTNFVQYSRFSLYGVTA